MSTALQILTERLSHLAPGEFLVKAGPRPEQAVVITDAAASVPRDMGPWLSTYTQGPEGTTVELSGRDRPSLTLLVRGFCEPITDKTAPGTAGSLLCGALQVLPHGIGETVVVAFPFPQSLGFVRGAHWLKALVDGVLTFWQQTPETPLHQVIVIITPESVPTRLPVHPTATPQGPQTIPELLLAMEKVGTMEALHDLVAGFPTLDPPLQCQRNFEPWPGGQRETIILTQAQLVAMLSQFAVPHALFKKDAETIHGTHLEGNWSDTNPANISNKFFTQFMRVLESEGSFLWRFRLGKDEDSPQSFRPIDILRKWVRYRRLSEVPTTMGLAKFQQLVATLGAIQKESGLEPPARSVAMKATCREHGWPWHDGVILGSGVRYIDILLPTHDSIPPDLLKQIYRDYARSTCRLRARYPFLNFLPLYRELFPGPEFQPLIAELEKIAENP